MQNGDSDLTLRVSVFVIYLEVYWSVRSGLSEFIRSVHKQTQTKIQDQMACTSPHAKHLADT